MIEYSEYPIPKVHFSSIQIFTYFILIFFIYKGFSEKKRTKIPEFRNSLLNDNIYPTGINITIPEHNQEATLYPQELTSTLLIQMLSWARLTGNTSLDCQSLQ